MHQTDCEFMKKALELAEKGLGLASPNPSVGCVLVKDGEIIGKGWHEYALKEHAEIMALREAGDRACGSTAYVTLEPCSHYGRTPPCAERLVSAGIDRVVVGCIDPNPLVSGKGIALLRSAGVSVAVGTMSEEAQKMIEPFACRITTGLPLIVSKVGMSLDGKIGSAINPSCSISSPEGKEFGQHLRLRADALLVGAGTILADDPLLTYRGKAPKAKPLVRVILDEALQTPFSARIFEAKEPVLIFTSSRASTSRRTELENRGAEVVEVPLLGTEELDLNAVLKQLSARNMLCVLVEGGSRIHWSFIAHNLIDVFYFIVSPVVLGGKDAVPSVGGRGFASAADALKFIIRKTVNAGLDLVLEAYPSCSRSIISPWLSR